MDTYFLVYRCSKTSIL